MSLSLQCFMFAHLFPSGLHYGQDSSVKVAESGGGGKRENGGGEDYLSILMHDGWMGGSSSFTENHF